MRVVLVDFSFIYAIVLSLLWVSSSIISRSNAASSLLNDPFYGISPQDENYYKTSSNTIKCKDGSRKFSKTQLNDDFCDCPDGTDEPGTSACPNGKFYCQNAGHSPLVIFSSRVNDGICDCCDGSDEYDGKIKCRNTCWEAGKVARDKLRKKIATYQEGVVLRKKEIEQAKQSLVNDEAELSKLKNEEKILKGLVQQLKERKEQIEKAEEKERLQREKEKKEAEEKTQKDESEFGEKAKQGKNEVEENAHSEDKLADSHDDEVGVSEESYLDQAKAEDHVDEEPATEAKHTVIPEKGTPVNAKAEDHVDEEPATEAKHTVIPEKGTPVNHAAEETKQSVSPKGKDGSAAVSETSLNAESQVPREEEKNVEDSASENTELSREELGRLVASRWTGEKNEKQSGEGGAKDNDQGHEEMPEYNHDGEEDGYATDTDDDSERYDSEKYDDNDMEDEIDETYREEDHHDTSTSSKSDIDDYLDLSETKSPSSPTWLEKIKQTVRNILQTVNLFQTPVDKSEAAGIRKEYDESSDKLSKIQSRISSLAQKLKQDFGPEKEFYSFYGHCFESKQNKYVYKVCPYKKATQEEEHTTTRLGSWDKFEDSYRIMLFSNGDKCWNGPDRSMKVRLRCGLKNEVADVDEPSRCEYVALLSTPAVCLEEKLQELQRKLDELNKEQPQRHDEL